MSAAVLARDLAVGHDGRPVLSGLDLSLGPGETLATLGTNGSGKTTLARAVVGLIPPVGGRLEVLGRRPGDAPSRVAFLPQSHPQGFVLPLRAADVVAMGRYAARGLTGRMRAEDRRLVAEGMERMGVARLGGRPLADLSGGQRQRVYLAQALAWNADLLVLDEPTSGLDPAGRELLALALAAERDRGAAVLVSTHDIADAMAADHVLLLAGRVVATGPPATTITREALLETFGIPVSGLAPAPGLGLDTGHHHDSEDHAAATRPSRTGGRR